MAEALQEFDVIVVGAGISGLYAIYRLRELGFSVRVLEAGTGVGGTWYWNRYPGARCDVESMSYSFSFSDELQQEWDWSHRYSTQPEILEYLNHVADRFDLRRDIEFETRVATAEFDGARSKWQVETEQGESLEGTYLIMATGCLSVPKVPDLPGLERFDGDVYHTANWPRNGVDFSGRKVGIVGTGSSAIQSIPIIAGEAEQLTVFQRTANFSIPAWNKPLTPEQRDEVKRQYNQLRAKARDSLAADFPDECTHNVLDLNPEQLEREFENQWRLGGFNIQYVFADALESPEANRLTAEFVRRKIRQTVNNPEVAEILCPKSHPFGTKRLCVDTHYYETFNRDNVTLVDITASPIETITETGIQTAISDFEFDALVLATGFDAMTGALLGIEIIGSEGLKLSDAWAEGPQTYLGLAIAGFPNLFTVNGPGSPSVLTNMVVACEQHVEWITECIEYTRSRGICQIEAMESFQQAWAQ